MESVGIKVALALLQFHGPTGARIDVNGEAISSIRDPANITEGHFVKGTHCVLIMNNGHFVTVKESCDEVRGLLREMTGPCILVCGNAQKK